MQKTGKAGKAKTKDMSATERMHREGAHGLEGSSCGWSLPPLQLRTPASGRRPPGYAVMRRRGMPASAGAFELGWYHDAFVPSGAGAFLRISGPACGTAKRERIPEAGWRQRSEVRLKRLGTAMAFSSAWAKMQGMLFLSKREVMALCVKLNYCLQHCGRLQRMPRRQATRCSCGQDTSGRWRRAFIRICPSAGG